MELLTPSQVFPVKNLGTFNYVTDWNSFQQALERLNEYAKQERPRLALDVETYFTKPRTNEDEEDEFNVPQPYKVNGQFLGQVKTIQIGFPPDVEDFQYVIDVEILEDGDIRNRQKIGNALRPILEKAVIYGQELKYEFKWMWAIYKIRLRNFRDCKLINQVLNAGNKHMKSNLAKLYDEYLDPHFFKAYTGLFQHEYEPFKKAMQKSNWRGVLTQEQIIYAAHDASKLIFELYDRMTETHEEKSVDSFITKYEKKNKVDQSVTRPIKLEWSIIPIFGMMELRGMEYDMPYHDGYTVPFLESKREEAAKVIYKYFPPKQIVKGKGRGKARVTWTEDEYININAWQQMIPALKTIGIDIPNYQEETLNKLAEDNDHEVIQAIQKYRKASSFLSKFGYAMRRFVTPEGKVHPSWNQMGGDSNGIATGRSSAVDPPLMTIPIHDNLFGKRASELCRRPFIANKKKNKILIDADYSQIEPRVMAAECNDTVLKEIYSEGSEVDRHSLTAKFMFGLDYMPAEDDPMRVAGKTFNLGSSYGMGITKMIESIRSATKGAITLTPEEMKEKKNNYFGTLSGLKRGMDDIAREVRKIPESYGSLKPFLKGNSPIAVIQTAMGRPRRWMLDMLISKEVKDKAYANPAILDKDAAPLPGQMFNIYNSVCSKIARDAFNFKMGQGCAADIFKLALVYVQEQLDAQGFDFDEEGIILVLHDEILLEVYEENAEKAREILKTCMEKAAYDIISGVHIKIGLKSGHTWSEAH